MTTVRVTDSTLRDGSHAVSHQFTPAQVGRVAAGLDRAGVPVIEVSHGDGMGGSSFMYGFAASTEVDRLAAAREACRSARLAILLLPGIGIKDDLRVAADHGVDIARIATHCTEADIAEQHIREAKRFGMEVVSFLMLSHMITPDALLEQARMCESYGADCVYVVDSAGHMMMDDVRARVGLLKSGLQCQVGIHAHQNLSLAVANSLAALEEGVDQIDGCTTGLGAGAGNCSTEVLVSICERMGIDTGIDMMALIDVAEDVVTPLQHRPQIIDRDGLILGHAGVYGSFLLHARNAAERYGVRASDILLELGRRKVVGGQEDMIIDVAMELQNGLRRGADA